MKRVTLLFLLFGFLCACDATVSLFHNIELLHLSYFLFDLVGCISPGKWSTSTEHCTISCTFKNIKYSPSTSTYWQRCTNFTNSGTYSWFKCSRVTLYNINYIIFFDLQLNFIYSFNYWEGGVGSINLSELTWLRASGAILHDGYDPVTTDNNIAILIFGVGINVPGVVPATLPAFGANIPNFGDSGTLAGFGFTSSSCECMFYRYFRHNKILLFIIHSKPTNGSFTNGFSDSVIPSSVFTRIS